jgi:predicted DNA-binding protein
MSRKVTKVKRGKEMAMKTESMSALRASVSFPPELYRTLGMLAKQKKVSLAWVVRDAVEKYVNDQWPLFKTEDARQ